MATADAAFAQETPADFGKDDAAKAQRWISEIQLAEKDHANWRAVAKKVIERYRDEDPASSNSVTDPKKRRFPLLWSNMEVLEPAVLARVPQAVVTRRWKDDDPIGRLASEVLERALNFQIDATDVLGLLKLVRKQYLLVGRGTSWVRYVPHMETKDPEGGKQQDAKDGQVSEGGEPYEVVGWEEAIPDFVNWDDFLHSPARFEAEVRWKARIAYMTRDELVTRFGQKLGKQIPLDHGVENKSGPDDKHEQWSKAAIYELWDKPSRKAIWISKSWPHGPLDERDDPLKLQDFFPCPPSALGTVAGNLMPRPDFEYYESQARDINTLTTRIGLLQDVLRLRGFYAAGGEQKEKLQDLFARETNTLIPVESWAAFQDKGGVKELISWVPLDMVVNTLTSCIEARKQLIEDVYQITGIADIMRGDVDPEETATATRKKETWGSSRVREKQKELVRFSRDLLVIMGQIIASKFSAETLSAMTNIQLLPTVQAKQQAQAQLQMQAQHYEMVAQQAQQMGQQAPPEPQPPAQLVAMLGKPTWEEVQGVLRDATMRAFRIDIETDSTIEPNDQDEKQRRIEFIQAVGEYVAKSIPAVQLMPQMLPVIAEGLRFLVRGFRVGREMEDTIDKALDQLSASAGQMQPPQGKPGPDPKAEQTKAQASMMGAQAKMQDAQTDQFRAQTDRFEAQAGAQIEHQRLGIEAQQHVADHGANLAMHANDIRADLEQAVAKGVERRFIHDMNSREPFEAPTQ